MTRFNRYLQACVLVSVKHVLYGYGAALCSVSNYLEHSLVAVCAEINGEQPAKTPMMSKDMN